MCLKSLLKPFTFVDCLTSKGKSFQNFGLAMEKMPDHQTIVLAYPTSRSFCTAADLSHLEYKEAITRFTITWILIFFLYHCHKSNTDNCYFLQLASVMCIISDDNDYYYHQHHHYQSLLYLLLFMNRSGSFSRRGGTKMRVSEIQTNVMLSLSLW